MRYEFDSRRGRHFIPNTGMTIGYCAKALLPQQEIFVSCFANSSPYGNPDHAETLGY